MSEDPMDSDLFLGLRQMNRQNQELFPPDLVSVLEGLDYRDFLTSPSPNNGLLPSDALVDSDMEITDTGEEACTQMNPGNLEGVSQNIRSPSNDPGFPCPIGAPMAPQTHAVPASAASMEQSERIDSNLGSLSDIEPMRLGSGETRALMMADPSALQESLGSMEDAPRNPSSQGPAIAEQSQAQPDSSQTTSPNRSTGRSPGYFEDYDLPEFHHFKVSVKFMSTLILEESVQERNGCLLHYQPREQPLIPVPAGMDRITIPLGHRDGSEFPWVNEKQKQFTERILKNFEKGVEFYTNEGNIYAKRKSNTKLFWLNEAQTGHALELRRNEETEVFNWNNFKTNFTSKYCSGNASELKLPAIWFSFAQKWDKDSSTIPATITTKLVWARVDPIRAREMVEIVNRDVKSTEERDSLHSSLFAISNEPIVSASH